MSRYRLRPSAGQEALLLSHCAHARYVWNLCVEQESHWRPGRAKMPWFVGRCRQLSEARAAALSTGELLHVPGLPVREQKRVRRLERRLARARRGSNRRGRVRVAIARLKARERDRRKDWAEKTSTDIAARFDVIRVEDLRITNMTRTARGTPAEPGRNVRAKAGLNRGILGSGWGLLVRRLEDKAPGRVEKIHPAYTSQRCSACGHIAAGSRESQALFRCVACGYA